jgi:hypothetical protein
MYINDFFNQRNTARVNTAVAVFTPQNEEGNKPGDYILPSGKFSLVIIYVGSQNLRGM